MKTRHEGFTFAKLRLCGDKLRPEEITKIMREQPSYAAVAGEVEWATIVTIRTFTTGIWDLESTGRVLSSDSEEHIQWLIAILDQTKQDALNLPGVEHAEMYCHWRPQKFGAGPSFSPVILGDLMRHGLTLTVDCLSTGAK